MTEDSYGLSLAVKNSLARPTITVLASSTSEFMQRSFGPHQGDEAISFSSKDCFAEFILSAVEGLVMT
jgi:hypothetical protein